MFNLNMNIFINDIIDYDRNYVEIRYSIINGVVDYEDVNEMGEVELIPGMDISDVYSNLEYDTHDFDTFLSDSVYFYVIHLICINYFKYCFHLVFILKQQFINYHLDF